jgi:hypothetical protein
VDPTFGKFIEDNFLDALVSDPEDPLFGQIVHFRGEEIEAGEIVVEGIDVGGGNGPGGGIPLPPAVWMGMIGAGAVVLKKMRAGYRIDN